MISLRVPRPLHPVFAPSRWVRRVGRSERALAIQDGSVMGVMSSLFGRAFVATRSEINPVVPSLYPRKLDRFNLNNSDIHRINPVLEKVKTQLHIRHQAHRVVPPSDFRE